MNDYNKYPRTYHLPWSLGSTNDDKFIENIEPFKNMPIVITEKMDGENTSMYPDRIHARSIDSNDHPSRHYVKGIWGKIKHEIPDGWRICGENMFAKHSIYYENLEDYFLVFSIWNENNFCLSWKDTIDICESLNLVTVPVLNEKTFFNENELKILANNINTEHQEGYVIRNINEFPYNEFNKHVAKYVREKHVTTDQHWMFNEIVPNKLKK